MLLFKRTEELSLREIEQLYFRKLVNTENNEDVAIRNARDFFEQQWKQLSKIALTPITEKE